MRRPELLIPASSLEVLKTAVIYGADAVYIGGEAFGLRAKAKNFSMEEMKEGIEFAHAHDVKVYVTANILAHNDDLEGVREYFKELKEIKPDALIIADPGVFQIAKEVCPEIERHVSTQTMRLICSGMDLGQSVSSLQESYRSQRSKRSGNISRMILRSRHLSMAQCVFPIPDAACFPIILPGEMQIREHVHIRADGSIPSWKRPDQMNICRYMKMSVEPIFLTQKISA